MSESTQQHNCDDFTARHFNATDAAAPQPASNDARSVFDACGAFKSQEELTRLQTELQWQRIRQWLNREFGVNRVLVWRDDELFTENVRRLEAGHFELVSTTLHMSTTNATRHYVFRFVRAEAPQSG